MEYPLRALVMVAQVQAGMWRRNGYSVINQVRTTRILFSGYSLLQNLFTQLLNYDKLRWITKHYKFE